MKTRRMILVANLALLLGGIATPMVAADPGPTKDHGSGPIERMGSEDVRLFDDGWLFARFGLQPDGTSLAEPAGLQNPEANDGAWRKLDLPHDWAVEGPFRIELKGETGKLPYRGIGWYRKHFAVPASDKGKHIYLDVDGAMAYARIWLNGNFVGTWPYGYSSFRMNLTPFLKVGAKNVLAIRLDTEKWDSRWYPGAGIYRHVWMVRTNPVHVAHWGTYITIPQITEHAAAVKIQVTLDNLAKDPVEATVRTEIFELDAKNAPGPKVASFNPSNVRIGAVGTATATSETRVENPRRWDLDAPNRYLARTTIGVKGQMVDTYHTPFGIRSIEFTARNGFLLNGRRVEVQGTCNHHDLGALGAAINTSALRRQLQILKEMGCNALRTSHNPPAPELLELADQLGFLVWDEAFDCWKTGKREWDYNKLYDEWHEKDLRAMVRRDRNNPSVFIWSIGNEVMDQRDVEMTRHLADIVRSEDPTRPVSNGYNDPDASREVGSPVSLDIMGVNYFFGRQAEWDADPRYANKPTIGSETSSCVSTRGEYFFGKDTAHWQISSFDLFHPDWGCTPDDQFRTNAKFPHLLGEFVWTGLDYLGEPTPFNSDETNLLNFRNDPEKKAELEKKLEEIRKSVPPSRSSYFGIVDLCGFPKDRFYLYQSHWRQDLPMAHILPHWNWSERLGEVTPVHVYTSGTEAELFVNGKSMGRKVKREGVDFRLTWDSVRYEPGVVKVVAYKNGREWATDEVRTAGSPGRLVLTADRNTVSADGADLAYITVKVQDDAGLTVPLASPLVQFTVEGPGEIVATDNGDPTSFVPFKSHDREAFNGLALVLVKAKKGSHGEFRVRASSKGLRGGQVLITIHKNDSPK
jgi:beta-galactosidase